MHHHVHTLVPVGTPSSSKSSFTLMCARGRAQLLEKVVGCLLALIIVTDFFIGLTNISDVDSGMLCHIVLEV